MPTLVNPDLITRSVNAIRSRIDYPIQAAVVLGSGLSDLATVDNHIEIPYAEIPGYPASTVMGHKGSLILGFQKEISVAYFLGRKHFYEGDGIDKTVFSVRLMAALGIQNLILTNAAGGIREDLWPGDIMMITDHLNFMGINPLIGKHYQEWGERFVDLSGLYNRQLLQYAMAGAKENSMILHKGIYAAMSGPSYETPAEIRMLKMLGADAVGMSTVPEAIVAAQHGMRVAAFSLITNKAAGQLESLNHAEVMEAAKKAMPELRTIIDSLLSKIDAE